MKRFIEKLVESHSTENNLPGQELVLNFLDGILSLMFPTFGVEKHSTYKKMEEALDKNANCFKLILSSFSDIKKSEIDHISTLFYTSLEGVYELLLLDAKAIESGDPAAKSIEEVIRTYPGFYAISVYRIAHQICELKVPFLPRILTEIAHSKTGIDIHPGAKIGKSFFIDHGTGVVIGETCVIGEGVKIYQSVTLGALSVSKTQATTKRHPTIEDNVVIYAGATILGGKTIIGKNSIVGGNVWLTKSIKENTMVYHTPELKIQENI